MPIYVFRCDDCGEKFERLQKLSDPDPDVCPNCGKRHTVHKQVTAPAFRLSGSGWYETDFKSDKEKKRNLAGDGAKPETSGDKPAEPGKGKDAGKEPTQPPAPAKETAKPAAKEKASKAAGD